MDLKNPSPKAELALRIMHLKSQKFEQEQRIKRNTRAILYSLHPAALARESLQELANDPEVRVSTTQTALKMGSRFLVYKVLGRFGGLAGVIGAAVAGNLSDKYLNKAAPKLLNAIGSFFQKKPKPVYVAEPEIIEDFEDVDYSYESV